MHNLRGRGPSLELPAQRSTNGDDQSEGDAARRGNPTPNWLFIQKLLKRPLVLEPPSRAPRRCPRERTRSTGRLLERAAEVAHRVHRVGSIEPQPVQQQSELVGNGLSFVRASITAGPIEQREVLSGLDRQKHLIRIANLNAEKIRELAQPITNPVLRWLKSRPEYGSLPQRNALRTHRPDAVVNANTVFIDDLGAHRLAWESP
jgi:hypothetical protein